VIGRPWEEALRIEEAEDEAVIYMTPSDNGDGGHAFR